jgi:hypothetical protein
MRGVRGWITGPGSSPPSEKACLLSNPKTLGSYKYDFGGASFRVVSEPSVLSGLIGLAVMIGMLARRRSTQNTNRTCHGGQPDSETL